MGVREQLRAYVRVLPSARRHRLDLLRWLQRRPQLLAAIGAHEFALISSARVDPHLKALAGLKAAALINCEFCLDIGSALGRIKGLTEAQLRALPAYQRSEEFTELEALVLELAETMTRTPTHIDEDLRRRLLERFTPAQVTELAGEIAWENHRARLNQALDVQPAGFSDATTCAAPER